MTERSQAQISSAVQQAVGQIADNLAASMAQSLSTGGMASGLQVDSEALMNAVQLNMGQEELAELLKSLFGADPYDAGSITVNSTQAPHRA